MKSFLIISLLLSLFVDQTIASTSSKLIIFSHDNLQFTSLDTNNVTDTVQTKKRLQPFSIMAFISTMIFSPIALIAGNELSRNYSDGSKYDIDSNIKAFFYSSYLITILGAVFSLLSFIFYKNKKHSNVSLIMSCISMFLILSLGIILLIII